MDTTDTNAIAAARVSVPSRTVLCTGTVWSLVQLVFYIYGIKPTCCQNNPASASSTVLVKSVVYRSSLRCTSRHHRWICISTQVRCDKWFDQISKIPAQLKCAEVSFLYKATDPLIESNFYPVSVLSCCISEAYGRIYYDQMYEYFIGILSPYPSAFRKKYGCHHVLIKLIEDWKSALDRGGNTGSIHMDLSKAFDCLLHRLLLSKSHAYGVSNGSCELIRQYLIGRK